MRAWLAVVLAGCYAPTPPAGAPCPDDLCPSGQVCIGGFCAVGEPADAAPCGTCSSDATQFLPCTGAPIACELGCVTTGGDHCAALAPSNEVDPRSPTGTGALDITGDTAVDVDTGAITGAFTRGPGEGVIAGVRFTKLTSGGVDMAVFGVRALSIGSGQALRFSGTRAVVVIVEEDISIDGQLDVSAGCPGDRSCGGPGGGNGARATTPAQGMCGGENGARSMANPDDGGGGGGGGGEAGGDGGSAQTAMGGAAGGGCIPADLVPLRGGGGGGSGGPGASTVPQGGGGGGAVQLVAFGKIDVGPGGLIHAGGDGGDGGEIAGGNAAAGAGGGGGGGILLEAVAVDITGVLAANGGGGGGGGNSGVGPGAPGDNAQPDDTLASGGAGTAMPGPGNGGSGGGGATRPARGGDGTNAGGGGGGRGVIRINATSSNLGGTITPSPTVGELLLR